MGVAREGGSTVLAGVTHIFLSGTRRPTVLPGRPSPVLVGMTVLHALIIAAASFGR